LLRQNLFPHTLVEGRLEATPRPSPLFTRRGRGGGASEQTVAERSQILFGGPRVYRNDTLTALHHLATRHPPQRRQTRSPLRTQPPMRAPPLAAQSRGDFFFRHRHAHPAHSPAQSPTPGGTPRPPARSSRDQLCRGRAWRRCRWRRSRRRAPAAAWPLHAERLREVSESAGDDAERWVYGLASLHYLALQGPI
jgi:hypothetical protein